MSRETVAGRHDIRVAVVGCGYWGRNHVRNYAELGALEAVVDRDPGVAAEIAGRHGVRVLTFAQALADPAVDAMVFALPPSQNHAMGIEAMEAGKHLFVEKPIALDLAHAQHLCEHAARLGRRLMVGHILRFHPAFLRLEALLHEGAFGALHAITSNRLNLGLVRREEDAWWALAPHDISMILALTGAEPETVTATGGFYLQPGIADLVHADLGFAGGVSAHVFVSWLHPFKEQKLTVIGAEAMAVFDDTRPWEQKLALFRHGIDRHAGVPVPRRGEEQFLAIEPREPMRAECLHFLDCIRTGATPRTDGWEALRVLRVLDRASRAVTAS